MKRVTPFIASVVVLLCATGASAAWIENGLPVCTSAGVQRQPQLVDDGRGGFFAVWIDERNGDKDIYAQRIDGDGNALWTQDGIPVCVAPYDQTNFMAIPDGAGGIILVWQDYRYGVTEARRYQYMTFAQRIDGSGNALWVENGQAICSARGTQLRPAVVSDGERGAIIAWYHERRTGVHGIYAQRMSASGMLMWSETDVLLWEKTYYLIGDEYPAMASDGAGGAIVCWSEFRSGISRDIYARKVSKSGVPSWGTNGIPVCITPSEQFHPCITTDGAGGAVVAWTDGSAVSTHIRAQRIAGDGALLWASEGVLASPSYGRQAYPRMVADGSGGAILSWNQAIPTGGIGLQRLDPLGSNAWGTNGVLAPLAQFDQYTQPIATDGASGAIVAGNRYALGSTRIVAERYDVEGQRMWLPDGVLLCAASGGRNGSWVIGDGAGGAFVAWQDKRSDGGDIYAMRSETPTVHVHLDIRPTTCPNPFNPKAKGVLPAAILGTADFDVNDIDPETIELAGVAPLRWSFEDVAAPAADDAGCACTDAGPDGFMDLTLKFDAPSLAAALAGARSGQTFPFELTGALRDETPIEGRDCVRIVGGGDKDLENRIRLSMAVHSSPRDPVQRLSYTLPEPATAEIAVYDVAGRLVTRFERFAEPAGVHVRNWDTAGLASGIYFCRVRANAFVETRKILLLR